jgi:hemerythrin-like domain-containing protein
MATKKQAKKSTRSKEQDSSGKNAIEMLREDHEKVQQMFEEFEDLKDSEEKGDLVELACMELTIHAQLEEEIFYPAVRDALDDEDLIDEAEVEHESAKALIAQLQEMGPDDDKFDAKFKVLGEYVNHHIDEEQDELFPKVEESDVDLEALGEQMAQRKAELTGEQEEEAAEAE